ncbi:MAG: HD domain-containing protein [Nitrosopumilus sp.]|uniref:HD domain-containing protein n=1 Tax=Nitrosopumilus sp. TaxID=2024843 RepID=UPI00242CB9C0|nr:HD domain-containing protein [Nitrosopumilus sp.]MCV0366535.1 HD domain-containing protein [Nitrosopumilus sp.]
MELVKNAELFAKAKHSGQYRKDSNAPYSKHLDDVVNRLKSLGVIDQEILSAGWLHDIIEETDTNFDDLYEQFGNRIAVIVSSLSKNKTLPRKKREKEYSIQLKEASFDAKLIKLCDISANLSDLKNYEISKSKKIRQAKQKRHYLTVIKTDLTNSNYPKIATLLETINQILKRYGLKSVSLQPELR